MPQKKTACTELGGPLRQSEILTSIRQFFADVDRSAIGYTIFDYVVVLSQDCDLEQDYNKRQEGKSGQLNGVLLFEAKTLGAMKAIGMDAGQYRKVCQDALDRYYLIPATPAEDDLQGQALPDLIIDFKRYFTIATRDLDWQFASSIPPQRRTRIISPYLEHLQGRMASYMHRVALPEPRVPSITFAEATLPPVQVASTAST